MLQTKGFVAAVVGRVGFDAPGLERVVDMVVVVVVVVVMVTWAHVCRATAVLLCGRLRLPGPGPMSCSARPPRLRAGVAVWVRYLLGLE